MGPLCFSDPVTTPHAPWKVRIPPRKWQEDALAEWTQRLRGVVSVVTGGGKTLFAELCIATYLNRFPNGRILIVVPTTALLDQWYVSLQEDLGLGPDEIALYSGEGKARRPSLVNLLVINTARTMAEELSEGLDAMLVVDECHRAGSLENARALYGVHRATLGLSATPERDYDEGFERTIAPALGEIIYRYDYDEALRDDAISEFDLVHAQVDLLPRERDAYDALTRRIAREAARAEDSGDDTKLKRLLLRRASVGANARMRIPAAVKLVESVGGQRSIVFHERTDAADEIQRILVRRGITSVIYHTGIGPALRRDNLRLFRKGMFQVLVCCRALDEGLNVPEASVAVIASSTASARQRIQRLGRVLRPAPGKDRATVYTIFATELEAERLGREADRLLGTAEVHWTRIERV